MFSPRNREMLKIENGEVFIDRDGYLFWYILQFYRTGVIPTIPTSHATASLIAFSQEDLAREIDYYQLPLPAPTEPSPSVLATTLGSKTVDEFISALCSTAKDTLANFRTNLAFTYFQHPRECKDYWANDVVSHPWTARLKEFEIVGFEILESVGQEIGQYLQKHLQGLRWKLELHVGNTPSSNNSYRVVIDFESKPKKEDIIANSCFLKEMHQP